MQSTRNHPNLNLTRKMEIAFFQAQDKLGLRLKESPVELVERWRQWLEKAVHLCIAARKGPGSEKHVSILSLNVVKRVLKAAPVLQPRKVSPVTRRHFAHLMSFKLNKAMKKRFYKWQAGQKALTPSIVCDSSDDD